MTSWFSQASEAWHSLIPERKLNDEAALKQAFMMLDLDGNGRIDRGELRMALIGLNGMPSPGFPQALLDEQVDLMIAFADTSDDGTISYAEYKKVIQAGCTPEGRVSGVVDALMKPDKPTGICAETHDGTTIYMPEYNNPDTNPPEQPGIPVECYHGKTFFL